MIKTRLPVPIRGFDRRSANGSISPPTPPAHVSFQLKEKPGSMSEGKMDAEAPVTTVGLGPTTRATGTEPKRTTPKKMAPSSLSSSSLSSFSNSTSSIGKSPRTPVKDRGTDGSGRFSSASNDHGHWSRPSSSSSGHGIEDQGSQRKVFGNSLKKAGPKSSPKPGFVARSHSNTETTAFANSPSMDNGWKSSGSIHAQSRSLSSGRSSSASNSKSPLKGDRDVSGKPFPIPVRNQKSPRSPSKDQKQFEPYMMLEQVQHGLKRGELIEGILRINPKSYEDAYISVPGGQMDIYIGGIRDRNRALNGDVVAVQINRESDWKTFGDRVAQPGPTTDRTPPRPKHEDQTLAQVPVPVLGKPQDQQHQKRRNRKKKPPKALPKSNPPCTQTASYSMSGANAGAAEEREEICPELKKKRRRQRKHKKLSEQNPDFAPKSEDSKALPVLPDGVSSPRACNNNHLIDLSTVPPPTFHISEKVLRLPTVQCSLLEVDGPGPKSALCDFSSAACANDVYVNDDDDIDVDEFGGKLGQVVAPDELSEVDSVCSESGDSTAGDIQDANVVIDMKSLAEAFTLRKPDGEKLKLENCKEKQKLVYDLVIEEESPSMDLPPGPRLIQKTGKVVYIIERKNSRASCGSLKLMRDRNPNWALFSPRDHRVPRMFIPMSECPKDFYQQPDAYANHVFVGRIVDWQNTGNARGQLCKSLGLAGLVEPESEAMLLENGVDFTELPDKLAEDGCVKLPWKIPDEEISRRKDLRGECVFTIDPSSARDLDDAVSCVHVRDNLYRVGVHIADVSYFIKAGSLLDLVAANRATSVYLIHKVVPMLPSLLCENLCSLNPGTDRLAFSIEWLISTEGAIYEEWMGKTVINSCAKLSYQHAQCAIEKPDEELNADEWPQLTGPWKLEDLRQRISIMHTMAVNLRKHRVKNGALRLDQTKLQFVLHPETGLPTGFVPYEHQDSNRLIEEFMLLANMAVGQKIYKHFPGQALLRCHPQPDDRLLMEVIETCANNGLDLDPTSAGTLQTSLTKIASEHVDRESIFPVLMHLLAKPMKCASYFCSGIAEDSDGYSHYALSVPIYTHFTSPIRRYPDIIVHRQLAAALGLEELYCTHGQEIQKKAVRCNDKKAKAKIVQEMSSALYLGITVRDHGPYEEDAVVCAVMDHSFDVLVLRMGIVKRVYCNNLPLKSMQFTNSKYGLAQLELVWSALSANEQDITQIVGFFSKVKVLVVAAKDKHEIKVNTVLVRPNVGTGMSF